MAGIISLGVASTIWSAHREIEMGRKLLADIKEQAASGEDHLTPPDDFGRRHRSYELGVPRGSGHRLFNVAPELTAYIIEAHIAAKQKELADACVLARMELDGAVGSAGETP